MIHYKVPKINAELFSEARKFKADEDEKLKLFNTVIKRHGSATKAHSQWNVRKNEVMELVNLYYYLKETKKEDPGFQAHIELLDRMLNKKGLILTQSSNLPIRQFTSMLVEPLVYEAINKSQYDIEIEIPEKEEGKQDYGVDLLLKKAGDKTPKLPFDVKTSNINKPVSQYSTLGIIKEHALTDNKKTEYILWASDNFEDGYITLKGREKWTDVKESILNKEGWEARTYQNLLVWNVANKRMQPLKMYSKKMNYLDKRKVFNLEFIGDFEPKLKREIEEASSWLNDEYKRREEVKRDIGEINKKVNWLISKDPNNLTKQDALNIEKTLKEIHTLGRTSGAKELIRLRKELYKFRENVNHPLTKKYKEIEKDLEKMSSKLFLISETRKNFLTDKDKIYIQDSLKIISRIEPNFYHVQLLDKIVKELNTLNTAMKIEAVKKNRGIKISSFSSKEKEEIKRDSIISDFYMDY